MHTVQYVGTQFILSLSLSFPLFLPSKVTESDRSSCEHLFLSESSALRPCFETVPTSAFLRLCLSEMLSARVDPQQAEGRLCAAAAAYVEQCRLSGVELYAPPACVRCPVDNGNRILKVCTGFRFFFLFD